MKRTIHKLFGWWILCNKMYYAPSEIDPNSHVPHWCKLGIYHNGAHECTFGTCDVKSI